MNQISARLQGYRGIAQHSPQRAVIAFFHQRVVTEGLPITFVCYDIIGYLHGFTPVNIILPGFPDRHMGVNIGKVVVKTVLVPSGRSNIQIKAGSLFIPALKQGMKQHPGTFRDEGCSKKQGDCRHYHAHCGQLGRQRAENKQHMPAVFFSGRLSKYAGTPEEKLIKKPYKNIMRKAAPRIPSARLRRISRIVPARPKRREKIKIFRRIRLF